MDIHPFEYTARPMNDFTCPCCGHKTLDSFHDWDCCPVCCWEDDVLGGIDCKSSANGMHLSQAQANFMLIGASSERRLQYARPAEAGEFLDVTWKPLQEALDLVRKVRETSE